MMVVVSSDEKQGFHLSDEMSLSTFGQTFEMSKINIQSAAIFGRHVQYLEVAMDIIRAKLQKPLPADRGAELRYQKPSPWGFPFGPYWIQISNRAAEKILPKITTKSCEPSGCRR